MKRRRRLTRLLLNTAATVSLVLCLATLALWSRAYDQAPPHIAVFRKMQFVKPSDVRIAGMRYHLLAGATALLPLVWFPLVAADWVRRRERVHREHRRGLQGRCPACGEVRSDGGFPSDGVGIFRGSAPTGRSSNASHRRTQSPARPVPALDVRTDGAVRWEPYDSAP